MTEQIQAIGLALGGAAGAGLMQKLGYAFSRDTLLRGLAKLLLPTIEPPKVLGVDDFAFRKGQRYGTILVDLEQHRPIALLGDRKAGTLAAWLEQHPGIEVLSRDRSKSYRQGMNQGALNAVQVADRFHLLQNLVEPLEQVFRHHTKALKEIEGATQPEVAAVIVLPPAKPLPSSAQRHQAQRQTRYEKIVMLYQQGWSTAAIAHQVRVSARTAQRYLKHEQFPERQLRRDCGQSPTLEPFKRQLLQQWNAGYYEARTLFRAIQQQGYQGSYQTVARYVRRLRQAQGLELRQLPRRRLRRTLGQTNRLKMLKRQMYGRAGLALLTHRFLLAG